MDGQATAPSSRLLLNKAQSAAVLGVSVAHFERHVQASLSSVRCGQLRLYAPEDLKDWADGHTTAPAAPSGKGPKKTSGVRGPDRRTRWPGVVVRHQTGCPAHNGKRCRCTPGYVARVWDPKRRQPVSSPTFRSPHDGVAWQQSKRASIKSGQTTGATILVSEAAARFIDAIKEGVALNKRGKPYKKNTIRTIEEAIKGRIDRELGSLRLGEVRRGHVQTLVDAMVADGLSGSRVRNVLNTLRALYRYAIRRELVDATPVSDILLPALAEVPRDRIATPAEFRKLLRALEPADRVPFALAAYATARRQELVNLTWADVDWKGRMLYLAQEEQYAKNETAKRAVPLIRQLRKILRAERKRQGRPGADQLVCEARKPRERPEGGKLSTTALYKRADRAWQAKNFAPIRLHECRHTAASWMRGAGIDLKARSVLMGHASTASANKGYGSITEDRYTHLLPGDIQKAGKRLSAYLAAQTKKR